CQQHSNWPQFTF
nr:immunoglobulin light chain junction region [Macaca mulatta]MPN91244.1 immunoglobulin light chain junction region [Macaca mulatta]MPN91284.1 immunoglobulin light chain junction region [Macaca mulatta]MPN91334.1 immunoglobulin light chain junction region [Macaca mulatta]MPN91336.1 immunoglobulin light chain junction region [Macaca mulatta]